MKWGLCVKAGCAFGALALLGACGDMRGDDLESLSSEGDISMVDLASSGNVVTSGEDDSEAVATDELGQPIDTREKERKVLREKEKWGKAWVVLPEVVTLQRGESLQLKPFIAVKANGKLTVSQHFSDAVFVYEVAGKNGASGQQLVESTGLIVAPLDSEEKSFKIRVSVRGHKVAHEAMVTVSIPLSE